MSGSLPPLYAAILCAHWVVFIGAPIALFRVGWPITGGLVMLLSTLMPITAQVWLTDSDAPGLAFLIIAEAPIAAIVLLVGITMQVRNLIAYLRGPA